MKSALRYIPGFRSGARWKKAIASIYYLLAVIIGLAAGLGSFLFVIGILLLVCSIVDFVSHKVKKVPSKQPIVTLVVAFALMVVGISLPTKPVPDTQLKSKQALEYLDQAETYIAEGKMDEALEAISHSKRLNSRKDQNGVFVLEEQIQLLDSDDFLKQTLIDLSDSDFELLKNGRLKTTFIDHEQLNTMFIDKLIENADKRAEYLAEIEAQRILAQKAAEKRRQEERKKTIEKQFSTWDGSHLNLTKVIKDAMNDPKSYQHVETVYWDKGDYLVVQTTFRGKNAFGGVVKNTVKAKVSLSGNVLEILEQW